MIRAVALYVDGEGPPPPELQYVFDWEAFGVLPNGGGTRDQRAGELQRMRAAKNVHDVWSHFREQREGWEKLAVSPDTEPLITQIRELLGE